MKKQENKNKEPKINEKNLKETVSKLEKEIINKNVIPQEEKAKIYKKVFENLFIASSILLFLCLIGLGAFNIGPTAFIVDLKVFSITLIVLTIILFEYSYKKDDGNICIHGIETLFLAVYTLTSIKIYTMYLENFHYILAIVSALFAFYYIVKSIRIYIKMKNEYLKGLNDINEIIKK